MRTALSLYHSLLLFEDQGQGIWSSLISLSHRRLSLCLRTQAKRTAQKDINTGTSKAGSPIFCGTSQKDFRSAEIYELSLFTCQFQWTLQQTLSNVRCVKNRNLVKCSHQASANTLIVCLLALSHKYKKHKNCTKQKYVFTSNKCRLCCCYAYSVSHTDWSHEPPSFLW